MLGHLNAHHPESEPSASPAEAATREEQADDRAPGWYSKPDGSGKG
jgi:hypothetical protein